MDIVIKDNGFVTGDFLSPIGYAGEKNSRIINVVHPSFEDAVYQIIVKKEGRPYVLGLQDGKVIVPPSLLSTAGRLECQFAATRIGNKDIDTLDACNCYSDSNDCSDLVFLSSVFYIDVGESLSLNGMTPVPTYEEILTAYNNLSQAKLMAEQSKLDSTNMADLIDEKIHQLQSTNYMNDLKQERASRTKKDNEILKEIEYLKNNMKTPVELLIEQFSNNAISTDNIITIISDTNLTSDLTIPSNITIVIPKNVTLTIDTPNVKVEGDLSVSGQIVLQNTSNLIISKSLQLLNNECVSIQDESNIKLVQNGEILLFDDEATEFTQVFGPETVKMDIGSLLVVDKDKSTLSGINSFENDVILPDNIKLEIDGILTVYSTFNIANSQTNLTENSKVIVKGDIEADNINNRMEGPENARLIITEYGTVPGLDSNMTYMYKINTWVPLPLE